jgi:hypothetical protein
VGLVFPLRANRLRKPRQLLPGIRGFSLPDTPGNELCWPRIRFAERLTQLTNLSAARSHPCMTTRLYWDDVAAGRFHGANTRSAANVLGAWLQIVKDETFAGDPPEKDMVDRIERLYKDIQNRLSVH